LDQFVFELVDRGEHILFRVFVLHVYSSNAMRADGVN
jgi:hypothetical protein